MKITSRFTSGVHTLLLIAFFGDKEKITSTFIANSINANPVIIRKILAQLKSAELIEIKLGIGGAHLIKEPADITLYDVFTAVEVCDGNIFKYHENPCLQCHIGKNIHSVLDSHLTEIEFAAYDKMKLTSLQDLLDEVNEK